MTWYLKYMTNHPEVQRKLRDHLIDRIPELQDRELTFDDVAATKVPYLEAVVQECLRLSRTAGGFAREGGSIFAESGAVPRCCAEYELTLSDRRHDRPRLPRPQG